MAGKDDQPKRLSRRALILGGTGVVAGLGAGAVVIAVRENGSVDLARTPTSSSSTPTTASTSLDAPPSSVPLNVTLPTGDFDGVDGMTPFTTSIEDHFLIDAASERPNIDPATYSLRIGGPQVRNPMTLSYDDLLGFEPVTSQFAMVCICLLYTSPSPRDRQKSRMPSSA